MMKVFDRTAVEKLSAVIQLVVMAFLIYISLMPVEMRWSQADLLLVRILPSICVLGVMILILSREKFCITIADLLLSLYALYYVLSLFVGTEYPCDTQCQKVFIAFLLYIALRLLFSAQHLSQWILVAFLLLGAGAEAIYGIFQLASGESRNMVYLITGNFLNPGPYSAYLTIGAVIGLTVLADKGRNMVVLVAVAIMLVVLPSTWSRAALLSVALPTLWLFRNRYARYRYIVCGILFVLAVAIYFAKKGSADGRLVIWMATLLSWRHYPLTGVGIGGFAYGYSEGISEMYNNQIWPSILYSADVTDNAFNFFLKILVEQGVIGLILFFVILTVLIKGLYSSSRPLSYGMLALLLFSMFSYPFEQLPYRIIAVTIAAWSESCRVKKIHFFGTRAIIVLVSSLVVIGGMFIRKDVLDRYMADNDVKLLSNHKSLDFIDDYYELLPLEEDNPQFLYDFATLLSENGRFNYSNKIIDKGRLVSADPMFFVIMGNNYYKMNQTKYAEMAYKKAFSVMPNRILPLYRLMLLYKETNQCDRALMVAKQIIDMKPKVASPATDEMKKNAKKLIMNEKSISYRFRNRVI